MAATALGSLKSLTFMAKAPAGADRRCVEKSNPTNHMRPTTVGAFILPSVGQVPEFPPSTSQTSAMARQPAIKTNPVHGFRSP
jgi:hypothetical protein